jgi:hypothetical protein
MHNHYKDLQDKAEQTFTYLEYIASPDELDMLSANLNIIEAGLALFDAVSNPLFSHKLAAILYYSLLLQANQAQVKKMVKH